MDQSQIKKLSEYIYKEVELLKLKSQFSSKIYTEEYIFRFSFIQGWFLRCSWLTKVYFLQELGNILNLNSLILILNSLYSVAYKDRIYAEAQGMNLYIRDKFINDNNRCLEENYLQKLITNEIVWFKILNDAEQYHIITGLIRLCDSPVINKIYKHYQNILKEQTKQLNKANSELYTIINKPEVKNKKKDKTTKEIAKPKTPSKETISNCKDEFSFKVFTETEKWTNIINEYKEKSGLTSASGEINSKRKKKPDKKKSQTNKDSIDQIQMLPVWINKVIIGYLDSDTIQRLAKVNKYWNFIVKDVKEDKKCRQYLNENITEMKERSL